jgi:hypothetical protein
MEAISRKLAEKRGALRELQEERARWRGSAEIAGDWSKREEALRREISDLEAKRTAIKDRR